SEYCHLETGGEHLWSYPDGQRHLHQTVVMQLFGDLATEITVRPDGDEALLRAYERVEFLEPVRPGDFLTRPNQQPDARVGRMSSRPAHSCAPALRRRHERLLDHVEPFLQQIVGDGERWQEPNDVVVCASFQDDHALPVALLDHTAGGVLGGMFRPTIVDELHRHHGPTPA